MSKINIDFLNHKDDTDVITFNLSYDKKNIIGDIYINIDMVNYNSIKYKINFDTEFKRVLFHSCLHLIGMNDKTIKEKKEMTKKENYYLELYNVSRETLK